MKSILLTCIFFCYSICSLCQSYNIKKLGIENGLSNNYVVDITQDNKGFLWFATESGLNRFDGHRFKIYKKTDKEGETSISGNELNKVYADKYDDIVWIATQREGLNMFDCKSESFVHFKHDKNDPHSIITNDITDITNSKDGNLWISTYYRGIEYYDKKNKKFIHFNSSTIPDIPSDNICSIEEDNNGLLFIGHLSSGLTIFSIKDKKIKNYVHDPKNHRSLPGNEVRAICVDDNNNVWIGTNNGLALFDREQEDFTVFRNDSQNNSSLIFNFIFDLELADGKLWISTENHGISILDIRKSMFLTPQNVSFTNIHYSDDKHGLSNPTVRSVYHDSFDNIWIGTYGGGVNFISHTPPMFNTWEYSPIQSGDYVLSNKIAWGICTDKHDNIWIGTDGGGINIFDQGRRSKVINRKNDQLTDNAVLAAIKDSRDNLWFGTYRGGINIFNSKNKSISNLLINGTTIDIRSFYEDNNGNMWVATSNGLYKHHISQDVGTLYTTKNSELSGNLVRAISTDEKGNMWIGFFGDGLSVYDKDLKKITNHIVASGFPSNTVDCIFKDSRSNMWIATGEGLVFFDLSEYNTDSFTIFNEKNGYINTHVRAITEDSERNIWISSNDGISKFNFDEKKFYNYDSRFGIPLGEFMSGSVTKDSKGLIYFGSQNGVCYFDPLAIPDLLDLPNPIITGFTVYSNKINLPNNEENIPISSNIKLKYTQNTFNISFNVLDYSLNQITDYSYMLRGLDNLWYETQGDNSVTFRNIPHGKYELLIKARIKNQDWTDNVVSMSIIVSPPWWLTWWAKAIYFLLICTVIFFILFFYKRKIDLETSLLLEKQNNLQEQNLNDERLRFFTNITHELRTPLTLILGPLEDLMNDVDIPEKQASKISLIYRSATRLLNLINQILEFRKTETQNKKLAVAKGDIVQLIHEIGLKYKELNINKKIKFNTTIESKNTDLYFDTDIITSILDNLLSNSFKYTQQGNIDLILRDISEDQIDYIEIEVRDSGRGISEESISKIFDRYYQADIDGKVSGTGIGLALVNNLVKLHQGEIIVNSKLGEGTSFKIRLKTANTYPNALHIDLVNGSSTTAKQTAEHIEYADNKQIILVIEDDEDILEYIQDSLSSQYKVYTATNGKKGLEKAYSKMPDIIISDIMMPEMDGFEFSRTLKQDVRTSHIPIILLTAKDSVQDRTLGYEIGVESYLTKPFSAGLLQSRIINLLEQRRKLAEQVNKNTFNKSETAIDSLNKLDEEFIKKVTSIIEQHLDSDKIEVAFIAEKMNMSHSTLYRKVKALSGISVNEFIRKTRINNAEKLLLTGKYTISEISYMVGFNSITYFRQCFKEEFGSVPSEYLKSMIKKE